MNILFIHDGFPGQFGHLAVEFRKRYNWKCDFIFQGFGKCPEATSEMFQDSDLYQFPKTNNYLEKCAHVNYIVEKLNPDIIIAHGIKGAPILLIKNIPIVLYCEYLSLPEYRNEIDNNVLQSLDNCVAGYSPTNWQKSLFPKEFPIEVIFDGIDTNYWCPKSKILNCDKKIITYVARGFEPIRGFDIFMKVAKEIHNQNKNVFFYIVGGDKAYYNETIEDYKTYILNQDDYNFPEFCFTGLITIDQLLSLLQYSDLHIYSSKEFIVSWSVFNAMACEVPVLALDTHPINEIILNGYNGVIETQENMVKSALNILNNPNTLGINARKSIKEKYSLDICVPKFKEFIENVS